MSTPWCWATMCCPAGGSPLPTWPAGARSACPCTAWCSPQQTCCAPCGGPPPAWWWTWYPDHVEVRDDHAALFVTWLGAGVYHYSYLLHVQSPGTYRALPAHVEAMYHPQINGHGAGQILAVR